MEITAVHAQCPILAEKVLSLGGSTLLLSPAFGDNSANCPTLLQSPFFCLTCRHVRIMECGGTPHNYRDGPILIKNGGLYIRYRSMCVKCESQSNQNYSDKQTSLMYCKATLSVHLTFCSVE